MDVIRAGLAMLIVAALSGITPAATALPGPEVHPAELCAAQPLFTHQACIQQTMLGSEVAVYYRQRVVGTCSSGSSSCTYTPEFHADATAQLPGTWILSATSREITYPGLKYVSGSTRSLECVIEVGAGACATQVDNRDVVGSGFNSARWDGSWTLTWIDPTGASHLMGTGEVAGWLAQYCECPA